MNMKGKLLKPISLDDITTVVAGAVVDIIKTYETCMGNSYLCKMPDKTVREIRGSDIVITDDRSPVDWDKIRIDEAIKAMNSLIVIPSFNNAKDIAKLSVECADAIIEELKK